MKKKYQRNKKKNFPQVTAPSLPIFLTHEKQAFHIFSTPNKEIKRNLIRFMTNHGNIKHNTKIYKSS